MFSGICEFCFGQIILVNFVEVLTTSLTQLARTQISVGDRRFDSHYGPLKFVRSFIIISM